MKIQMLLDTYFNDMKLKKGDAIDVEKEVAERWCKNGICEIMPKPKAPSTVKK